MREGDVVYRQLGRTRQEAERQIYEYLKHFQTDHVALMQHHESTRMEDQVLPALVKNGIGVEAMKTLVPFHSAVPHRSADRVSERFAENQLAIGSFPPNPARTHLLFQTSD